MRLIQRKNKIYRKGTTDDPNVGLTENDYKVTTRNVLKIRAKFRPNLWKDGEFQQRNGSTSSSKI